MAMTKVDSNNKKVSYSAKAAAAGKDIGKPGKNFQKIADKYPGEKGKRIAGAVLANLRSGAYKR